MSKIAKKRRIVCSRAGYLPYEMVIEICLYLKLKYVYNCLLVSKQWNSPSLLGNFWEYLYERDVTVHHNGVVCFKWLYKEVLRIKNIDYDFDYDYYRTLVISNGNVALGLVIYDYRFFGLSTKELKDDKEVVMEAVKNYGWAFAYASDRLKDDKDVLNYYKNF